MSRSDGKALHRLGLAAQYLVRPDGHIAYRAGKHRHHRLARYLRRWLRQPPTTTSKPV